MAEQAAMAHLVRIVLPQVVPRKRAVPCGDDGAGVVDDRGVVALLSFDASSMGRPPQRGHP